MDSYQTYRKILANRHDMTEWLIHFTRKKEGLEPKEALRKILIEGTLIPGFSERNGRKTIYGPYPAVCFSEQPLSFFKSTLEFRKNPDKMAGYGLLIHKQSIFKAGGLPVIYGIYPNTNLELKMGNPGYAENFRLINPEILPINQQYRYVAFNPRPVNELINYNFIDWTHEREWRWKASSSANDLGEDPANFQYFRDKYQTDRPYIHHVCAFVETANDVAWLQTEIEKDIKGLRSIDNYSPIPGLIRTKIISLENTNDYLRFEDIPEENKPWLVSDEKVRELDEGWQEYRVFKE